MKTLVILLGNARGGEKTWNTMYKHLLEPYQADLALLFGETNNKSSSLYSRAKFIWELPEYTNWREYYEKHCDGSWESFYSKNQHTGISGGIDNYIGSGAIIFAYRHYLKNNFKDIIMSYDRIILSRSDHFYVKDHEVESNEFFYVVEGEDHGGICDRHHIFPSHMFEQVLGIVEYISNDGRDLTSVNPESALKAFYNHNGLLNNIRRSKRVQFTVKLRDDQTRWSKGFDPVPGHEELLIKYPEEYKTVASLL